MILLDRSLRISTLLLAAALAPAAAAPGGANPKACEHSRGGVACIDASGLRPANFQPGAVLQVDLGSGRNYACHSTGRSSARGAYHAECRGGASGASEGGALNVVEGSADGQVYGSTFVDGEVCNFGPDATGTDTVVRCTRAEDFPPEEEPNAIIDEEAYVGAPPGEDGGWEEGSRARFRELVTGPVEERRAKSSLRGQQSRRGLVDDLGGNLDVMVIWTEKAECRNSGLAVGCTLTSTTEANMRGRIDLAMSETNTAYDLSGVNTALRLVHAYRDESYVEPGSFSTALNQITSKTDGVMDDVHAKRTQYGADIVALIVDIPGSCGIAWLGPSYGNMFSVTGWNCATGYYSFGHEIGHNMGCNHDKGTSGQCTNTSYNYGWRDPNASFRTILAYNCGANNCANEVATGSCTRIQRFSNPTGQYNGKALGSAQHDNARRINDVKATIAAYEPVVPSCASDAECDDGDSCTIDVCDGICYNNPVDCNDNDACTEDTCSAGSCFNTPVTCDDGNSCKNWSCDVAGGCSFSWKPGCCGNNVCEPGSNEDTNSCSEDCDLGPFTAVTPTCTSCNILDGNMFDVVAKAKDIRITSLKMYIYVAGVAEVWTRLGTHEGFSYSSSGWVKVAEHDFSGTPAWTMAEIPESSFTQSVDIAAGTRQAFYITLPAAGDVLYNSGVGSTSAVNVQNDHLTIYEGPAKVYGFGGQTTPRVWNGEMTYIVEGAVLTLAPTTGTTPPPTKFPTNQPTNQPTTAQPTNQPTNQLWIT